MTQLLQGKPDIIHFSSVYNEDPKAEPNPQENFRASSK